MNKNLFTCPQDSFCESDISNLTCWSIMMAFENDTMVLTALEKGDSHAFDHIYHLHFKPLCYFAETLTGDRELAQDMVADCFVKLLQKKPRFDTLGGLRSFLYTTTRNSCFDYFRSVKRHRASHLEMKYLASVTENDIENNIIRAEVLAAVHAAIETLPAKYKEVVRLALIEGKNNDEIATETGMAYQTVRNHKSEGLKLLRLAIFKNGDLSDLALVHLLLLLSQYGHRL